MRKSLALFPVLCLSLMACSESSTSKKETHTRALTEEKLFLSPLQVNQNPVDFREIGPQLTETMLKCPEKIWPNYSWKDKGALFSEENGHAFYWDGATGETIELSTREVPDNAKGGLYNKINYRGKEVVSFYLSKAYSKYFGQDQILPLIVHEGFHFWGQNTWTQGEDRIHSRGTAYPASAQPRIYRQMLMKNLIAYTESAGQDETFLQKAAYWNELWKKEFSREYRSTTDGYEGTARYVDSMADIIAKVGCTAKDEDIQAASQQEFTKLKGHMDSEDSVDGEGYPIGGTASLILQLFKKDSGWHQQMALGQTPTDILLKDVTPLAEGASEELLSKFETKIIAFNKEAAEWLETDLAKLSQKDYIRVSIPDSALQGSFGVKAFLTPIAYPETEAVVLNGELQFQGNQWATTLPDRFVIFKQDGNICSGTFGIALVHKENLSFANNYQAKFKGSDGPKGTIHGKLQVDQNGFSWFCGE